MRIDEVSREWSPAERLRVIEHLLGPVRFRASEVALWQRRGRIAYAHIVSCYDASVLNDARGRIGELLAAADDEQVADASEASPAAATSPEYDMTPRYVPDEVLVVAGGRRAAWLPVLKAVAHPPGDHPVGCPLRRDCTALELRTDVGSRWFGCARAYVNSELRMVVVGTPVRDEVRMKWPVCTTP